MPGSRITLKKSKADQKVERDADILDREVRKGLFY